MIYGLVVLGCSLLAGLLPVAITLLISCSGVYMKARNIKKRIVIFLIIIGSGLHAVLFFFMHHLLLHRWNFILTVQNIIAIRFRYQDICYFSVLLFIGTIFAMALGIVLKAIVSFLFREQIYIKALGGRQRAFLLFILSISGIIITGSLYVGFTGQYNIVINEVCADTIEDLGDGIQKNSDCIELHNTGILSCELYHIYLSDDRENLRKLEIPYCQIPADGYVVIEINEVFSIKKAGGETIFLSDSLGHILDQVTTEQMYSNYSYARYLDGKSEWKILSSTLGISNSKGILFEESKISDENIFWIEEPVMSHKSGFYGMEFDLTISSEPGTSIYYTLDGSIPTEGDNLYTGSIHVYDKSQEANKYRTIRNVVLDWKSAEAENEAVLENEKVDKAFVIRAIAVSPKGISKTVTGVYFIGLEEYQKMPVVSLVVDPNELWGEDGIYVTGKEYDKWYLGKKEGAAPEANFMKSGRDYEVKAYMDYISASLSFSQNIGVRINGGSSRKWRFKRFSLYSRKIYNGSYVFDANVFKDAKSHKLILRDGYANAVYQDLVRDRNFATQRYQRVSVFLNGEFWYETNLMEDYEEQYFKEWYKISKDNIIVLKHSRLSEGKKEDLMLWKDIYDFLDTHNMKNDSDYEDFQKLVDIQSYIDFMCTNIYFDNMDFSEVKNVVVWRSREKRIGKYEDGKWRWALYDLDAMEWADCEEWTDMFTQYKKNSFTMMPRNTEGIAINQQTIYRALKENFNFRKQFVLSFMDLVNQNFSYENVLNVMERYGKETHSYHKPFFENRAAYIVPYMAHEFELNGTLETIEISVNNIAGGKIQINTIIPDLSSGIWKGDYYTDYPVTVTAWPASGYEFVRWEGDIYSEENILEIPIMEGGVKLYGIFKRTD